MITVELSKPLGVMLFDSAFAKNEYGETTQKTNADGVPLWTVNILLRQPDSKKSENLTITVPSKTNPADVLEPFTPIAFERLRLMTGQSHGRTWVSFAADRCGKPKQ